MSRPGAPLRPGVFLIPVSMAAAELGTARPHEGGVYAWVEEAFGGRTGEPSWSGERRGHAGASGTTPRERPVTGLTRDGRRVRVAWRCRTQPALRDTTEEACPWRST